MFPIVCHGCGERETIPFIPADLTCCACKTGEHIDLDDLSTTAVSLADPWDPMMNLPSGTPDQDMDVEKLRTDEESTKPRKVTLPEGSTPYSQKALSGRTASVSDIRALLAQFNGKNVTVTYDDDLGLHTTAGPLVYHPPAVMVGKAATTDVHVMQVTVNGYGDADPRTSPTGSPSFLDYAGVGASTMASKTAMSYEDEDGYDKGFEDGITGKPMGDAGQGGDGQDGYAKGYADGQAAKGTKAASKMFQIAAAVRQSNPGLLRTSALRVARKTVAKYPKVAG